MSSPMTELEGRTRTSRFPTPISNSPPSPRRLKRTRDSDSPVPIFQLDSGTPTPPPLPSSYQMSITTVCISVLEKFVTFGANVRAAIVRHLAPPVPEQTVRTTQSDDFTNEEALLSGTGNEISDEAYSDADKSDTPLKEPRNQISRASQDVPPPRFQFLTAVQKSDSSKHVNSALVYQVILAKRDKSVTSSRPIRSVKSKRSSETYGTPSTVRAGRIEKVSQQTPRQFMLSNRKSSSVKSQSQTNQRKRTKHSDSLSRRKDYREPDHTLEGLINTLVANKEDGFHSYARVQEERAKRQAEIDKLRAAKDKPKEPIVLPLSKETAEKVKKILQERNSSTILIDKYRIQVRVKDVQTLRPRTWLNDEVINFYLALIVDRGNAGSKYPKVFAFNSFFYDNLCKSGYNSVARWARRGKVGGDDMLRLSYLIVPVHLGNHWTLGMVNFVEKRLEYYDSLGGRGQEFFRHMRIYLKEETKGKLDIDKWPDYRMQNAPVQANGYDCGVFLCKTAEIVCKSQEPLFTQKDISNLRNRMVAEIVRGKIGVP